MITPSEALKSANHPRREMSPVVEEILDIIYYCLERGRFHSSTMTEADGWLVVAFWASEEGHMEREEKVQIEEALKMAQWETDFASILNDDGEILAWKIGLKSHEYNANTVNYKTSDKLH